MVFLQLYYHITSLLVYTVSHFSAFLLTEYTDNLCMPIRLLQTFSRPPLQPFIAPNMQMNVMLYTPLWSQSGVGPK